MKNLKNEMIAYVLKLIIEYQFILYYFLKNLIDRNLLNHYQA